jgi:hypothetical protein
MKKKSIQVILFLSFCFQLVSCNSQNSGSNKNNESLDAKAIFEKARENDELTEEEYNKVLKLFNEASVSSSSKDIDTNTQISINSYDLFRKIYSDRSINLSGYLDKSIIITDLYVYDIKTVDRGDGFIKVAYAIPFNPKSKTIINYDNMYSLNGSSVNIDFDISLSKYYNPITIEFKNADELSKIGLVDWEHADRDDYSGLKKIDVVCNFNRASIEYKVLDETYNNMKVDNIKLTLTNAVLYTTTKK